MTAGEPSPGKAKRGRKRAAKPTHEQWLIERIPGRPKPFPAGYALPFIVAELQLIEAPRLGIRILKGQDKAGGRWSTVEPFAFAMTWLLLPPDSRIEPVEMNWTVEPAGLRQFAVGEDERGRWSIQPTRDPTRWKLLHRARLAAEGG